ncbi:MAG: hypothetical protein ABF811_07730 [Pseudoclavibacter sp.]
MDLYELLEAIDLPTVLTAVAAAAVTGLSSMGVQVLKNAGGEIGRLRRLNQEASELKDHDPVDEVLSAAMRRQVRTRLVSRLTFEAATPLKFCWWVYIVIGALLIITMLLLVAAALVAGVGTGISVEVFVLITVGLLMAYDGWANWQVWRTWNAWRQTLNALLGLPTTGRVMTIEECERYRPGHLVPPRMRPNPTDPAIEAMKILAGRRP